MNQYTLDGVPLKDPTLKWHPTRDTGIRILPARRQAEQRFPGVDGLNFIPGAPYDPGAVSISLQVTGKTYKEFRENLEFITGLFAQRNRVMELRDHYDGTSANDRVAGVTLSASVEPVMIDRQTARVGAVFSVPESFWRSAVANAGDVGAITGAVSSYELTPLKGGNAPVSDMLIRIAGGGLGSAQITDVETGNSLNINTPLVSGETLLIDAQNWNAVIATGTVADGGWSLASGRNVSGLIVPGRGYGSMFVTEPSLVPRANAFSYNVTVSGTNVTGSPKLSVRARRSYL